MQRKQLEELSAESVKELSNSELKNMRERANQMYRAANRWSESLSKNLVSVTQPVGRDELMESYSLVVKEMARRGLPATERRTPLDAKLVRRRLRGVDVSDLPPILVRKNVICLSGDFVWNPKAARAVEVRMDVGDMEEEFSQELEKRMVEALYDQADRATVVHRDGANLKPPVVPMYDLVLVPRSETSEEDDIEELQKRLPLGEVVDTSSVESVDDIKTFDDGENVENLDDEDVEDVPVIEYVSKPYPSEHSAPQRKAPPGGWDSMASKKLDDGVRAILGIKNGKSKVASIRFKKSRFTVAEAKKWLKDHDYKTEGFEPASGVKKAEEAGFVKNEEQRIVGGIVYEPLKVDSQGDYVDSPEEIFEGMKSWMIKTGGRMKLMHEGRPVHTPLVECFQADLETWKSGEKIPAGAWYISNYIPLDQEDLWKAIKDGTISGYSMAGEAEMDEV